MKRSIIPILIIAVMLGYARGFMPSGETVGFAYDNIRINSQWYWYILFKDIRSVLLVWLVWYIIPKKEVVLKLGISVFAVMITLVPINFILFYSAPFHVVAFIIKLITSIIIGFFITYKNGREADNNNSSYY